MKVALVPIETRLGDFSGNLSLHKEKIREAAKGGASLVVFPELSLVGYSPMDLMERPSWDKEAEAQLSDLRHWLEKNFKEVAVVVGTTIRGQAKSGLSARGRWNAAVFLAAGEMHQRAKTLIPYYDVFHESRYFDSADQYPGEQGPISWKREKIGLLICEDSWSAIERNGRRVHSRSPSESLVREGATLLVNISASPHEWGKRNQRRKILGAECRNAKLPFLYVNHFGSQNDLLFDGDAFYLSREGAVLAESAKAQGESLFVDLTASTKPKKAPSIEASLDWEEAHSLLALGIASYARKNGFQKAVLGLSGGIDSALVAALAVKALGPANVTGLLMPSKYSSPHSLEDAEALASGLGIRTHHLPIKMIHSTAGMTLKGALGEGPEGLTDENLQSRIRGLLVMAFANESGAMALATGNKSELAVGYSTLYGDLCGALLPIGDLFKTEVYGLARWMKDRGVPIPTSSIEKAPSAELRPNQKDEDSLPPYDRLDAILKCLVVDELTLEESLERLAMGGLKASKKEVAAVLQLVRKSEFKRFQSPPILRLSSRAFGSGRLVPIASLYS